MNSVLETTKMYDLRCGTRCDFLSDFYRLAQESRLESIFEVVTRYDFTSDLQVLNHIQ